MTEGWVRGWPNIATHLNCHKDTAKKYAREYALPIQRDPAGWPVAMKYELDQWLVGYNKAEKRKKNDLS